MLPMSDDVFAVMRQAAATEANEDKQLAFQERIVKRALRYAGVTLNVGMAKRAAKETYGFEDLGFRWFNEVYSNFPLHLMSQKMPYTHKTTLADIYGQGRFKKLPWFKEYEAQAELAQIDLQLSRAALIFNLPHAKDAFLMVLHNQPTQEGLIVDAEQRQDEPWPRTTFPLGKSGITVVLESFPSFMQTVGTDWANE